MNLERGLVVMKGLGKEKDIEWQSAFATLESRLRQNLNDEQRYGNDRSMYVDRARIIESLNRMALLDFNITFNELCLDAPGQNVASDVPTKINAAIITVREDEYNAVLKRLPNSYSYKGDNRTYIVADVNYHHYTGESGMLKVALIRCLSQGTDAGQDTARDVIEDLKPEFLMLVGISGGMPSDDFTLGDVALAMQLQDYSVFALIESSNEHRIEFALGGGQMDKRIQDHLASLCDWERHMQQWNDPSQIQLERPQVSIDDSRFYGSEEWKNNVKQSLEKHFGNDLPSRKPKATTVSTASSGALLKDTSVADEWLRTARNTGNIEMELAGVYKAARRNGIEYPIIAIRSISDIIGYKRSPEWTAYACEVAASFAIKMVQTGNLPRV